MNKNDIKEILKTAISLFLICAVSAGILAFVNSVTAPKIAANSEQTANESRQLVLPSANDFEEVSFEYDGETVTCYKGTTDGITAGFVFTCSGKGYGGEIEIMVGTDMLGAVTGIEILTIDETPGLGMNAKKESFLNQFAGKSGEISVVKSEPGENEIQAITSATITSKAVTSAVNDALKMFAAVSGKGE